MNSFSTRPAYSLIFAFLVMTVLLIVAGSAAANTRSKLALYNDLEGSEQALLTAQSAAELGIAALKQDFDGDGEADSLPGYEGASGAGENIICEGASSGTTGSDCESTGSYTIHAKASPGPSDLYYLPMFGTGTAGLADDCSILDYVDADPELVDVDNPCNWNKLLYGQSVTIPLFDTDNDTGEAVLPADLGLKSWSLKIRTPCSDESMASDCDGALRYVMDEDSDSGVLGGDSIVFWQLVGVDSDGKSVSLIPDDTSSGRPLRRDATLNTEIYESLINDAGTSDFVVLKATDTAPFINIYDMTMETTSDLNSLALQLSIVTPLKDSDSSSIPYLEWQLTTDSLSPLADNKSIVLGEGATKATQRTLYAPFVATYYSTGSSLSPYTLSN